MATYRQGTGLMKQFTGSVPTQNEDGSPYAHQAEDFFRYYLSSDPNDLKQQLVASVELDQGVFSREEEIDAMEPGVWYATFSTVNVILPNDPDKAAWLDVPGASLQSDGSVWVEGKVNPAPVVLEILAPLSPPLYPGDLA